jgi:hypothetical protein
MIISPTEFLGLNLLVQWAAMNVAAEWSFQHYRIVCNEPKKLWQLKSTT